MKSHMRIQMLRNNEQDLKKKYNTFDEILLTIEAIANTYLIHGCLHAPLHIESVPW